MRRISTALVTLVCVLSSLVTTFGQTAPSSPSVTVPRLIHITGAFQPVDGQPPAPVEIVTLSIYADADGGLPVWQERQSVAVEKTTGRFTLLLGASYPDGIPAEVFGAGQAHWMSLLFERLGEVEQPRVRIASVPYALKASDAETLGGLPASAYLRAPTAASTDGVSRETSTVTSTALTAAEPSLAAVLPGTTNFLAKYVNSADVGNSAVYETPTAAVPTGAVGIGTTAPLDQLHLRFNNPNGAITGLAVQNLGNTSTSYSGMLFYDQFGALAQFQGFNNITHEYRINNIASNASINLMTGSTSRLFIAPNGNVGIAGFLDVGALGTNPNVSLSVGGPSATPFIGSAPIMQLSRPAQSGIKNTNSVGFSVGAFEEGILGRTRLDIRLSGLPTDSNTYGTIPDVTVMTMKADGKVGIGTTSPVARLHVENSDLTTAVFVLNDDGIGVGASSVDGYGVLGVSTNNIGVYGSSTNNIGVFGYSPNYYAGYFSGNVHVTGTVTQNSDLRLKKAVNNLHYGLHEVLRLRPVSWNWKDQPDGGLQLGLIAQEVEGVLPELITTAEDADQIKGLNYIGLLPVVIKAIQEQQSAFDQKDVALKSLAAENAVLQQRVSELERLVTEMLAAAAHR